jgi:chromosome segregation ATPase
MSIVSETEMKEFFQRLIDSVAELSTQASKVDGLVQQVQQLSERLNNLEQENYSLKNQISDANNTVARMDNDIQVTRSHLENEKAVTQALRQTILERDAGVQSLENSFRQEQDSHKITTSERDDARLKVTELEGSLNQAYDNVRNLTEDRNTWRNLATDHERELAQVKSQLESINKLLNPLRVVSSDVA